MRLTITVLLTAFIIILPAARATAAPTSLAVRETLPELARTKFDEGSALYKAGSYQEAKAAFLGAYQASLDPRVLYNVAVCEKGLGRFARAIDLLKTSASKASWPSSESGPPESYSRLVEETVEKLSHHVGYVAIDLEPKSVTGVAVFVDGERVTTFSESGTQTVLPLDLGSHLIRVAKDGYSASASAGRAEHAVTIGAAGTVEHVRFSLNPLPKGSVTIECAERLHQQKPCEVWLDGSYVGRAPVTVERAAGKHTVRASLASALFDETQIDFEAGSNKQLLLEGTRLEAARLRVATEQPDDIVTVDGKEAGRSGMLVELQPGEHHVVISRQPRSASSTEPRMTKSMDLVLRLNETRDVRITFEDQESQKRDEKKRGLSPWWFVGGGGAVAVIAAVTVGVIVASSSTTFEGSAAGTLNPYTVPASFSAGGSAR